MPGVKMIGDAEREIRRIKRLYSVRRRPSAAWMAPSNAIEMPDPKVDPFRKSEARLVRQL